MPMLEIPQSPEPYKSLIQNGSCLFFLSILSKLRKCSTRWNGSRHPIVPLPDFANFRGLLQNGEAEMVRGVNAPDELAIAHNTLSEKFSGQPSSGRQVNLIRPERGILLIVALPEKSLDISIL